LKAINEEPTETSWVGRQTRVQILCKLASVLQGTLRAICSANFDILLTKRPASQKTIAANSINLTLEAEEMVISSRKMQFYKSLARRNPLNEPSATVRVVRKNKLLAFGYLRAAEK
jgi:hypothetical protein